MLEHTKTFLDNHSCSNRKVLVCSRMSVHNVRSMKICFDKFGLEEIEWPSQSPGFNSIERIWEELECPSRL